MRNNSTFFGLWEEERVFSEKIFLYNRSWRFQKNTLRQNDFCFEKFSFSYYHFWSLGNFFVFIQNSLVRCVKTPIQERREQKMGKLTLKNSPFFKIINGLWAEKIWNFSKTVSPNSQNRSLRLQMNIFRNMFGSKIICMKVFRHWTEASDFLRKCFLRVVKGAVHVSSATLRENDDRGRLYFLWLV